MLLERKEAQMCKQSCEYRKNDDFLRYIAQASAVVKTWPTWKQTLLGTTNSSHCQEHTKETNEKPNSSK